MGLGEARRRCEPPAFTAKKKNSYTFIDAAGRSVILPSAPYIALRVRRLP
jgi:hypothetical protein